MSGLLEKRCKVYCQSLVGDSVEATSAPLTSLLLLPARFGNYIGGDDESEAGSTAPANGTATAAAGYLDDDEQSGSEAVGDDLMEVDGTL